MKRKIFALAAALLFVLAAVSAYAECEITVSGDGVCMIPADVAMVTLGVTVQKADVLEAQAQVNRAIESIRNALIEEGGFAKENINTDSIRIYARYDYSGANEEIIGYNASSSLAIRTTDMENVGTIIDIAFANGANTLEGIEFSNENTQEARSTALTDAVLDAKDKAEIIAKAAGLKITGIKSIQEAYSYARDMGINAFYKNSVAEDSAAMGAPTLVQSAKLSVTAQVSVVFLAE